MVHISKKLVGGCDLFCILVRVVLLEEGEAVHVAVAQPLAVIPITQTLPLTWEKSAGGIRMRKKIRAGLINIISEHVCCDNFGFFKFTSTLHNVDGNNFMKQLQ